MKHNQQPLSHVEESILIVLEKYELYGLEIIAALESGSGGKLKLGIGTLYPTLRRLQKKGCVKVRWGDEKPGEGNGARRRYYTASPQGKEALVEVRQVRADMALRELKQELSKGNNASPKGQAALGGIATTLYRQVNFWSSLCNTSLEEKNRILERMTKEMRKQATPPILNLVSN